MLNVADIIWSFADDIVFKNLSLVLFAQGCKWGCPGCQNPKLQSFEATNLINDPYLFISQQLIEHKDLIGENVTIVGSGGDFFFQLDEWIKFCKNIKKEFPFTKTLWYTGAEFDKRSLIKDLTAFDAILWGKLNNSNGKVIKHLSLLTENHERTVPIVVSDFVERG